MKVTNSLKVLAISAACIAGGATVSSAATFSSCVGDNYDISGRVDNAADCTISDDFNQDFLNTDPMTVNVDPGFFDIDTWEFVGKLGEDFQQGDEGQEGSYDLTGLIDDAVTEVMLLFKSGQGTFLVGYLMDENLDLIGDWDTPFSEPPFTFPGNNDKDVSHISLYVNKGDTPPGGGGNSPVPLPAGGVLIVSGLGALAALRRRKSKS